MSPKTLSGSTGPLLPLRFGGNNRGATVRFTTHYTKCGARCCWCCRVSLYGSTGPLLPLHYGETNQPTTQCVALCGSRRCLALFTVLPSASVCDSVHSWCELPLSYPLGEQNTNCYDTNCYVQELTTSKESKRSVRTTAVRSRSLQMVHRNTDTKGWPAHKVVGWID